jgi:hypothetical protein
MRAPRPLTEFKIVAFEGDHAFDLIARNTSKATADYGHMIKEYIEAMELPGHGYSLMKNGHLIASAGVYPVWEGLGEAWVVPSDLIYRYKIELVKQINHYFRELLEKHNYRRVQATVRADFETGHRFIEFFGFKRESLLKSYGPDGADHVQYALLREV